MLTERQLCDLELILNGGFSPLEGASLLVRINVNWKEFGKVGGVVGNVRRGLLWWELGRVVLFLYFARICSRQEARDTKLTTTNRFYEREGLQWVCYFSLIWIAMRPADSLQCRRR